MGSSILQSNFDLNVLIVDDSPGLRQRLAEMLKAVVGLNIVGQAHSVAEARWAIQELKPNLVVLDLQLGDGNGIEILRETKEKDPSIMFVVFTNQSEIQYRQRCANLGADYFLCKSTGARSLIALSESLVTTQGN